jgi:hypothetical protein
MSAVNFFRGKLMPKGARWIDVKSLAGHLSQAPQDIRNIVGPQVEFGKWLARHEHIFEVRDGRVRLQKDVLADSRLIRDDSDTDSVCSNISYTGELQRLDINVEPSSRRLEGSRTTKLDQKLVWLLKDLIRSKGSVDLETISNQLITHGPIELLGIGEKVDPVKTMRKYPGIFKISENNIVTLSTGHSSDKSGKKSAERSRKDDRIALMACSGPVYHLSKLWGIIDLGQHEHVFFDQSILEKPTADLRTEYQVGETLYFDAVRAPKTSRAKWKAVRIWKEIYDESFSVSDDEEQFDLSPGCRGTNSNVSDPRSSQQKGSLLDMKTTMTLNCESVLEPVDSSAEQLMLNNNWRNVDFLLSPMGDDDDDDVRTLAFETRKFVDAECQTISTGDIIATQFYFAE